MVVCAVLLDGLQAVFRTTESLAGASECSVTSSSVD